MISLSLIVLIVSLLPFLFPFCWHCCFSFLSNCQYVFFPCCCSYCSCKSSSCFVLFSLLNLCLLPIIVIAFLLLVVILTFLLLAVSVAVAAAIVAAVAVAGAPAPAADADAAADDDVAAFDFLGVLECHCPLGCARHRARHRKGWPGCSRIARAAIAESTTAGNGDKASSVVELKAQTLHIVHASVASA